MRSLIAAWLLGVGTLACSSYTGGDTGCMANFACTTNMSYPCRLGVTACTPVVACLDDANVPAGTDCGLDQVCNGSGKCVACTAGLSCTDNPGGICHFGITTCAGGGSACVDYGHADAGVPCGESHVCNGIGECVPCAGGCSVPDAGMVLDSGF